jgi:hypothetical protein
MNVETAVNYLRQQGIDVVQTLEEYFVVNNGKLVMISESQLVTLAQKTMRSVSSEKYL